MNEKKRSRGDKCVKCGESRGAIMDGPLICWDGYDEMGKHRFKPYSVEEQAVIDSWRGIS